MSFVSKSRYLDGLQCAKLLWSRYNAKDTFPAVGSQQQAIFDQGKEVGDLAKQLFPGGIEISCDHRDYQQVLRLSKDHLALRKPLFEAGFEFNGGYARVDILEPTGKNEWDIIEVKSSTEQKDVHLHDIAFQKYVLTGVGLKIKCCHLLLIDNSYVRKGEVNPKGFFKKADVSAEVQALIPLVGKKLPGMQRTIKEPNCPDIKIGPHCNDPYACPLHDLCWKFLPENSVFDLYRGGKKSFQLLERGIKKLTLIPDDVRLTVNQAIQKAAVATGKPYVDRPAISAFLKQLEYPISFLDFETFNTAIPLFDDVRPYQQVPFQFSLHVVKSEGANPEHIMFLADGTNDPRPEFMANLTAAVPKTGSIIVYNASFERNVMKEGSDLLNDYRKWVLSLEPRIVDLLQPFRGFRYYHPDQHGSGSMKAVLPALTGKGYEHLAIQEGGTASLEFLRVTFTSVSEHEKKKVRKQLEEYCGLDTLGMVWIVGCLSKLARKCI